MYGSIEWSRLDNAAKIFPSTGGKTDTNVFRFYCELKEEVMPEFLKPALDATIDSFPGFSCVLKKGLFWYYLERANIEHEVYEETGEVCGMIYEDSSSPLFRLYYYRKRISLEIYHAMTDGAGALVFLKTIIYNYLKIARCELFGDFCEQLDVDASFTEKDSDSFSKYYKKRKHNKEPKPPKAYHIKQKLREDGMLLAIEGIAFTSQVLKVAREHNASMTVFLAAALIAAIRKDMPLQCETKSVVINIPVNLRKMFPSETTRNFFGMISANYNFLERSDDFSEIIKKTTDDFSRGLDKDSLSARISKLTGFEKNPFVRIAPLVLKNIVLRIARRLDDSKATTVLSNVGKVEMPPKMAEHVEMFGVLASTREMQLCVCSFEDKLQMGFTSAYNGTDIQKNFFRELTSRGIELEIRSNDDAKRKDKEGVADA